MPDRGTLTVERIVAGAVAVADRGGLGSVSMRSVGRELGVEAMSLYHHVTGKEAVLDALADWVFAQVPPPVAGSPWREAMAARADALRAVMSHHPWALGMVESRRAPGTALLGHHDAVLGCLLADGFDVALAGHAFSVLDAYIYGFVLTEVNLPFEPGEGAEEFAAELAVPATQYPHLTRFVAERVIGGGYAYGEEFRFGLDLILDGLEERLGPSRAAPDS